LIALIYIIVHVKNAKRLSSGSLHWKPGSKIRTWWDIMWSMVMSKKVATRHLTFKVYCHCIYCEDIVTIATDWSWSNSFRDECLLFST